MSTATQTDAEHAWHILVSLVMESRGDWRRKISEATGMPFSRYRALKRLRAEPRTLRDLAEEMGADAPATTVLVDDLESRGLVKRQPHPTDRRAKLVSLTAAGRRQLAVAQQIIDEPPAALTALPQKELAVLRRVLEKIES